MEHPYKLIAVQGVEDLLANASANVLPVVPQLVLPLRHALNTRIPEVRSSSYYSGTSCHLRPWPASCLWCFFAGTQGHAPSS
jgi:hypothetical protein